MQRSLLTAAGALLLSAAAAAQGSPLLFELDNAASQFTFSGTTSIGPIVGNPPGFGLTGTAAARLSAGLINPIGTVQFVMGGTAVVTPDISASIPNPFPFLPPLATLEITGLSLRLTSGAIPVGATNAFSGSVVAIAESGIITVTPLGSAASTIDLAGVASDPQAVSGSVASSAQTITLSAPVSFPFTFTDPGSGISATIDLAGLVEGSATLPTPSNYCSAEVNSTGASAGIGTSGTASLSSGSLELTASALPQNSLGYFLFASDEGFVPMFGGSSGNLCLSGQLFRLSSFVQSSGGAGQVSLPVPYGGLPGGNVFDIGDAWNFQYWFRDSVGGVPTSNTTDGLSVTFAP